MSYQVTEKQVVFEGRKIRLELHHLHDEEENKHTTREVVIHPGAVVVLPMLDEQQILLIRNKRHSIGQTIVELPAGTLEKGESPMNAAGRELVEETGYLANRLTPLLSFFTSPGIMSEKIYVFVATGLEKKRQALDEGEEIELMEKTFDEAIDMVRHGQIIDAKTIATLLFYDRFHRGK